MDTTGKKNYKAVIFDFDLTLADSSQGILICFQHTLREFGYPVPDDKSICSTIGIPLVDGFDVLTGEFPNPHREEMRRVYARKGDEVMAKLTFFYPDTLSCLRALRERGMLVGIASSKMRYRIEETFDKKLGERPYDLVLGLDDVERPKPDPQGLILMARRLGVTMEEIFYVGDSLVDAQTAKNAGVDFGGVTTGNNTAEELAAYPHVIIGNSLTEVLNLIIWT